MITATGTNTPVNVENQPVSLLTVNGLSELFVRRWLNRRKGLYVNMSNISAAVMGGILGLLVAQGFLHDRWDSALLAIGLMFMRANLKIDVNR